MKLFLSHSSKQKPLVREIKNNLPNHILSWIDEEKLLIGDELESSLEAVIKTDIDYVLLFLDESAANSNWVRREIKWAIETENRLSRGFLLPIIIDDPAVSYMIPELAGRKYLQLKDFTEDSLRNLSSSIASELFALICRDLHQSREPKKNKGAETLDEAEVYMNIIKAQITRIVFPHRQNNPIAKSTTLELLNQDTDGPKITEEEFETILTQITQRALIPGLSYDGFELFLAREHIQWKYDFGIESKISIARKVSSLIQDGASVYIDAGTTTGELINIICHRIETRSLSKITLATTSVSHADAISRCCVNMGFDDAYSAVKLIIPGGIVRPGTQAIIPTDLERKAFNNKIADIGCFDIGIVAANGVHPVDGFTLRGLPEVENKKGILEYSKKHIIVSDSSKVGITLDNQFASWNEDVCLVVNGDSSNPVLLEIEKLYPDKIMLV